jgi:hypothetical protein
MQVSVFSMFDGLVLDIPAITSAVSKGWTVARPALVKGAVYGLFTAIDVAAHLVHFSRLTIESGRQHRAKYGARYATVLWTVLGLLAMLVRAQLGREGAYVELCEAVVAARELVKGWVWVKLVRGYEVWLAMVSKKVIEILGYAPEWVQKAVLVGE